MSNSSLGGTILATRNGKVQRPVGLLPWLTPDGLDVARYPIDRILVQAISSDFEQFRSACNLLRSMCGAGRAEAGIFLIGLLHQYPDDYLRLSAIAQALSACPTEVTAACLAGELRRVKGSSATRGYLRCVVDALEGFPAAVAQHHLISLARDPQVGPRFRQRLRTLTGMSKDLNCLPFDDDEL
jgi:hypothetical protein